MDTVTHGLAGWLAGRALRFPDGTARREGTAALVAGSLLPDADNAASLLGSEFYLRVHRGLSHSLFAIPVTSLLLALLFYRFGHWKDLRRLYLLCLAGQLFHAGLDLLNSYGTQIFQPLSDARVSFDVLFVVDLVFTGIVAAGIAASRGRPGRARAALFVLALYVAAAAGLHLRAEGMVREAAAVHGVPVKAAYALPRLPVVEVSAWPDFGWARRAEAAAAPAGETKGAPRWAAPSARLAVPLPAGPFAWNGFVDDGRTYVRAEVDPLGGEIAWRQRVPRAQDLPAVRALGSMPDVRTWLWFARFPTVEVRSAGGRTVLLFSDLRFAGMPGRRPFRLEVVEVPGGPPSALWPNPLER